MNKIITLPNITLKTEAAGLNINYSAVKREYYLS